MTAKRSSRRPAAVPKSAERLGKLLVEAGLITPGRIADALRYQEIRKIKLGQALIELGFASYRKIAYALSIQLNIPYITLRTIRIKKDALPLIPREIVMDFQLIPLKRVNGALFIVVAEPPVADLVKALSEITKMPVHLAIAPQDEVAEAIKKYYPAESLRNIPITGAAPPVKRSVGGTLKSRPSSPDNRSGFLPDKKHHKTPASGGRSDQLMVKSVKRRAGTKPSGEKHGQKRSDWRWPRRTTAEAHPFESGIRGPERTYVAVHADHHVVAGVTNGTPLPADDTAGIFNISKPADSGNHPKGNRFFGVPDTTSTSARDDHPRFDIESPSIGSTDASPFYADVSARMGVPMKQQKSAEAVEYFEMGLSALNEGSGREALRHFEAALAMDPDNRLYRANIERLKKKNSEAQDEHQ